MGEPVGVQDVAQYILDTLDGVTTKKLQKLCYYAQGFALAKLKTPLFMDDIDRWQHGPVISSLWREYSQFGSNPIPLPESPLDPEIFRNPLNKSGTTAILCWNRA